MSANASVQFGESDAALRVECVDVKAACEVSRERARQQRKGSTDVWESDLQVVSAFVI